MKVIVSILAAGVAFIAPCLAHAATPSSSPALDALVAEALERNPEIQAARRERDAARNRVTPAGALDDPMVEAGVLNFPTESRAIGREDMTMKMIGLSQRFPFPGKRDLRRDVAAKDAESVEHGFRETVNRVLRELKLAYYDLTQVVETERLTERNRTTLEQLLQVVESRYAVGQSSQADALKAQTQLTKMLDELLRLARERVMAQAEIGRLLAQHSELRPPLAALSVPADAVPTLKALEDAALQQRPQLQALQSLVTRSERSLELARKEALPDFDVRLSYGQRNNTPTGMKRDDFVTFTVAMNLPVWRETKIQPRIAEAQALRDQALATLHAQQHDATAKLHHQTETVRQSLKSLRLYERDILPQARLTLDAALTAYKVNRVDFLTLLDNQMSVFNYEIARVAALVGYHKAATEIDFLTGKLALDALGTDYNAGEKP